MFTYTIRNKINLNLRYEAKLSKSSLYHIDNWNLYQSFLYGVFSYKIIKLLPQTIGSCYINYVLVITKTRPKTAIDTQEGERGVIKGFCEKIT